MCLREIISDMYLYGASGHGLVIKDIVEASGDVVEGFIDDDASLENFASLPVIHSAAELSPMIISIGSNAIRCKVSRQSIHEPTKRGLTKPQ